MLPKFLKNYFSWLQAKNPTGVPEKYPQQDELGQKRQTSTLFMS